MGVLRAWWARLCLKDVGLGMAVIKLALPGFRHSVEWWGLPTRLEWARIPDRGFLGYLTGSLTLCMAFGRPQRSWVQELKPSSPARFLLVVEAGGRSPGRSLGFDHPKANRCMTNSCRDTEAPPFLGVSTPYLLYGHIDGGHVSQGMRAFAKCLSLWKQRST